MVCKQCGKYNPDFNRRCDYCQAPLSDSSKENMVSPVLIGLFLSCMALIISIIFFIKVIVPNTLFEDNNQAPKDRVSIEYRNQTLFTKQIGKEGL